MLIYSLDQPIRQLFRCFEAVSYWLFGTSSHVLYCSFLCLWPFYLECRQNACRGRCLWYRCKIVLNKSIELATDRVVGTMARSDSKRKPKMGTDPFCIPQFVYDFQLIRLPRRSQIDRAVSFCHCWFDLFFVEFGRLQLVYLDRAQIWDFRAEKWKWRTKVDLANCTRLWRVAMVCRWCLGLALRIPTVHSWPACKYRIRLSIYVDSNGRQWNDVAAQKKKLDAIHNKFFSSYFCIFWFERKMTKTNHTTQPLATNCKILQIALNTT